jgi:glyoxylase-like metal-dependent hydrolase (beta-lactamase superfamily II)
MANPPRLPLYRRFFWGEVGPCVAVDIGDVVEAGPYRLTVIPTPGHAPDHLAFWEEREGWLFAGDLLLSPRLRRVQEHEDPLQILESLRRLAALPVRQIFCCHAKWVPDSVEPLLKKIEYWERLRKEGAVLKTRGLPLRAVARRLLGRPDLIEWVSGGEFSRVHLMRGLLREV